MRSRVSVCLAIGLLAAATCLYVSTAHADDRNPTHQHSAPATTPSTLNRVVIPEQLAVGLLIHKVNPEYPKVAKKKRISGIVILHATISKTGEITDLFAVCGPKLLQDASLTAVSQWKYRPYLLRDAPVEVETTVRVTFSLGEPHPMKFSEDSCPVQ